MEYEVNDQGQTLIYLTQEEWEDYGRQAGYYPELVKEANTETAKIETDEPVSEEVTITALQNEIKEMKNKIASLENATPVKESAKDQNGGVGSSSILIREDSGFNEENYPNLVAEQEQDGLIGPFRPRT